MRRLYFAWWITYRTYAHSEYVILPFTRQKMVTWTCLDVTLVRTLPLLSLYWFFCSLCSLHWSFVSQTVFVLEFSLRKTVCVCACARSYRNFCNLHSVRGVKSGKEMFKIRRGQSKLFNILIFTDTWHVIPLEWQEVLGRFDIISCDQKNHCGKTYIYIYIICSYNTWRQCKNFIAQYTRNLQINI